MDVQIGFNGRFFAENWRPAREEIGFASCAGFDALQWMGKPDGLTRADVGDELEAIGALLQLSGISAVMEIIVRVNDLGRDADSRTPLDILEANLPAIDALNCSAVHWHLTPPLDTRFTPDQQHALEKALFPQLADATAIGQQHRFRFGLEHNAPNVTLFNSAETIASALNAVDGLGFVWDLNHTPTAEIPAFEALLPRLSMLHVSDTPLPDTNYHWELGRGNVDFAGLGRGIRASGFDGIAILEIGGAPWSGGFDQDSDDALKRSLAHLRNAWA